MRTLGAGSVPPGLVGFFEYGHYDMAAREAALAGALQRATQGRGRNL